MSIKDHPNIHAVGFTTDIYNSFEKWLRGDGKTYSKEVRSNDDLEKLIVDFVVNISTKIDEIVEVEKRNKK